MMAHPRSAIAEAKLRTPACVRRAARGAARRLGAMGVNAIPGPAVGMAGVKRRAAGWKAIEPCERKRRERREATVRPK